MLHDKRYYPVKVENLQTGEEVIIKTPNELPPACKLIATNVKVYDYDDTTNSNSSKQR